MSRIRDLLLRLVVPALGTSLTFGIAIGNQTGDIGGAARLIFGRMENPPTGGGHVPETGASTSGTNVDDALALGNAARDRKPPDLDSAERAYRLAWKLNPRDPRPYVGLGNIYMDRGKYADAAKAYQEAIRFGPTGGGSLRAFTAAISQSARSTFSQSHASLGAALLGEKSLSRAEKEFGEAVSTEPRKAEWRAWLGYCLFQEERFTEASAAYKVAVQLQPSNDDYQSLLKQARGRAEEASAKDSTIIQELQGTVWDVLPGQTTPKGTCQLLPENGMRCSSINNELQSLNPIWKVQDGLLMLIRPATSGALCIGRPGDNEIQLKCLVNDVEFDSIWRRP